MFKAITVRGVNGQVLFVYKSVATLRTWAVTRTGNEWHLQAVVGQVDNYLLGLAEKTRPDAAGCPPLSFAAPRKQGHKGWWTWPILPQTVHIASGCLRARLGPPAQ